MQTYLESRIELSEQYVEGLIMNSQLGVPGWCDGGQPEMSLQQRMLHLLFNLLKFPEAMLDITADVSGVRGSRKNWPERKFAAEQTAVHWSALSTRLLTRSYTLKLNIILKTGVTIFFHTTFTEVKRKGTHLH